MNVFDYTIKNRHEKLVFCSDKEFCLRANLAIPDPKLDPAMNFVFPGSL